MLHHVNLDCPDVKDAGKHCLEFYSNFLVPPAHFLNQPACIRMAKISLLSTSGLCLMGLCHAQSSLEKLSPQYQTWSTYLIQADE